MSILTEIKKVISLHIKKLYPNDSYNSLGLLQKRLNIRYMSKTFLITYDLKRPGQSYSELYEAIKNLGDWQHPLESTWMVKVSNFTFAQSIYEALRPQIDENDLLFIVDITNQNYQGWLSKTVWTWLK